MCSDHPPRADPIASRTPSGGPEPGMVTSTISACERLRTVALVQRHRLRDLGVALEVTEHLARRAVIGLGVHKGPQHPVVEGEYLVALRLRPPELDELVQQLRVLAGEISRLRQVLG